MADLISRYIAQIQSIIVQLYADLDSILEDTDTTAIKAAIKLMEDILHQYEK